jgi:hypothetical protein
VTFRKGQPRPVTSGRKKGTPNRHSLRVLDDLEAADINLLLEFKREIAAVKCPEKRMAYWQWLIDRVYPKLKELDPLDLLRDVGAHVPAADPVQALPPSSAPAQPVNTSQVLQAFLAVAQKTNEHGS